GERWGGYPAWQPGGVPLTFRTVAMDAEPAASLMDAMREEMRVLYDDLVLDGPDMPAAGPRELGPPGGTFLVGFDELVPVSAGAALAGSRSECAGGTVPRPPADHAHDGSRRRGVPARPTTAAPAARTPAPRRSPARPRSPGPPRG